MRNSVTILILLLLTCTIFVQAKDIIKSDVKSDVENLFEQFSYTEKYAQFKEIFTRYTDYFRKQAVQKSGKDRTSPFVSELLAEPLDTPAETKKLTDMFFTAGETDSIKKMLKPLGTPYSVEYDETVLKLPSKKSSASEIITFLEKALSVIKENRDAALANLNPDQAANEQVKKAIYSIVPLFLASFNMSLYIDIWNENTNKANNTVVRISEVMAYEKLLNASYAMSLLFNKKLNGFMAKKLSAYKPETSKKLKYDGVKGKIRLVVKTDSGDIVIGDTGKNTYKNCKAAIIIDLGGNDIYSDGAATAVTEDQPVSIVMDFSGDDTYKNDDNTFGQAAAFGGIAGICDLKGDDKYLAPCSIPITGDIFGYIRENQKAPPRHSEARGGQALAVNGVAMLIDYKGNDEYQGTEFCQGVALGGYALLYDAEGDDKYQAELYSQGIGMTNGVGVLFDNKGNDKHKVNGAYPSTYGDKGEFNAMSMGIGIGFRCHPQMGAGGYGSGGVGILLNGSGNDEFDVGQFGLAGGYYFGIGIVHTKSGNDVYKGQRYSMGFAPHQAIGILIDESGDDSYTNTHVAVCAGTWDTSLGFFIECEGDDKYDVRGLGLGGSTITSFSVFYDGAGKDFYKTKDATVFGDAGHKQDSDRKTFCMAAFIDKGKDKDVYERGGSSTQNLPKNNDEHNFEKKTGDYVTGYGVFSDGKK